MDHFIAPAFGPSRPKLMRIADPLEFASTTLPTGINSFIRNITRLYVLLLYQWVDGVWTSNLWQLWAPDWRIDWFAEWDDSPSINLSRWTETGFEHCYWEEEYGEQSLPSSNNSVSELRHFCTDPKLKLSQKPQRPWIPYVPSSVPDSWQFGTYPNPRIRTSD
jgi:hypothetical protein